MRNDTGVQADPVVVVGAGPTGLATALELVRQGMPVRILDKSPTANTESRGTGLQARTLELLDLYDATDAILARANMTNAFIVHRNGKEIGRIDFTLAPSRFAGSPALPQAITEGILRARLARSGVTVEYDTEVISFEQDSRGCTVHAMGPDGEPSTILASYIVGADGARSPIRTLLDLPFDGVSYPEGWGLMDATLDWSLEGNAVRIFRGDGPQQFVVVPLGGKIYRIQLSDRDEAAAGLPPTAEEMQAAYDRYVPIPGSITNPTWRSSYRLHRRQVVAYRKGRVLLAGDAAHIHTPAGAQGLNTGIQDGINLGWKLALVASGKADPALLDTYQDERKPIAAGVLQLAEVLARNPTAMLGDGSLAPEELSARVGQLLVNYREGPLGRQVSRGPAQLVAGDRLPDIFLGSQSLYRCLRPAGVTVAVFGPDTDVAALQAEWGESIHIWRVDADDPDGDFADALNLTEGAAAIRPDAYLGPVVTGRAPSAAIGAWLADCLKLRPATFGPKHPHRLVESHRADGLAS